MANLVLTSSVVVDGTAAIAVDAYTHGTGTHQHSCTSECIFNRQQETKRIDQKDERFNCPLDIEQCIWRGSSDIGVGRRWER
jgi:hypothetical protein